MTQNIMNTHATTATRTCTPNNNNDDVSGKHIGDNDIPKAYR